MSFSDDECSLCHAIQSSAINLTGQSYLLSECGHVFCHNCIQREKKNFPCPNCKAIIKIYSLSTKTKDEYEVDKDINIRRKLKSVFNKRETDFATREEYNSYQEFVEDIIFNVVHGIDVSEMNSLIEKYKAENMENMIRNQALDVEDQMKIKSAIQEEKYKREQLILTLHHDDIEAKRVKAMQDMRDNAALLGDSIEGIPSLSRLMAPALSSLDLTTSTSTSTITSQVTTRTPFMVLLSQRKELKLLTTGRTKVAEDRSAGGYMISDYTRKNWMEIGTGLQLHGIHTLNNVSGYSG